jgi:hypothetical protein
MPTPSTRRISGVLFSTTIFIRNLHRIRNRREQKTTILGSIAKNQEEKIVETPLCAACYEVKICTNLCGSNTSCKTKFCKSCIKEYLTQKVSGFAICQSIPCPGQCGTYIPMDVWSKHVESKTFQRYFQMLISRSSIRCPGCHGTKHFAGHAHIDGKRISITASKKKPEHVTTAVSHSFVLQNPFHFIYFC